MSAIGPGGSRRGRPRRHRMIGFILIVVGCVLLIPVGYQTLQSARESSHWPRTQGVIDRSVVEVVEQRDGSNMYFARIRYTYTVGDSQYTGTRIRFGTENAGTVSSDQAERLTRRYPVTQIVDVYYDPASPEIAVLERGPRMDAYVLLGVGVIALGVGLYLARS